MGKYSSALVEIPFTTWGLKGTGLRIISAITFAFSCIFSAFFLLFSSSPKVIAFSKYLKEIVGFRLIFRVYGNHFIIIPEKDETFGVNYIESLNEYTSKYDKLINVNLKKINIIQNNIDSIASLEKYL